MEMLPIGVKRDGSYYTRIEWASTTESDPTYWVCNILRDDHERDGGTWGAHTKDPVELVLSFFGEKQTISRVAFYRNVGASISVIEELAKTVKIYVSDTDEPAKLRTAEDDIESVSWKLVKTVAIERDWGWQEVTLDEPAEAKYVRITMVENDSDTIDWTEMNEIKLYP